MPTPIRYRLAHQESLLGIAYFTPAPAEPLTLEQSLDHIQSTPNDEFMRAHVRPLLAAQGADALFAMFTAAEPVIRSLILETVLLTPALSDLWSTLQAHLDELTELSPQLFLTSVTLPDHDLHAQASLAVAANIFEHKPLPQNLPAPLEPALGRGASDPARIAATLPVLPPCPRRPAEQTHALAMERLYGLGILDGPGDAPPRVPRALGAPAPLAAGPHRALRQLRPAP